MINPHLTVYYNTRDAGIDWLAALFGDRVALPVTRFVYDRFADLLFAWNRESGRW